MSCIPGHWEKLGRTPKEVERCVNETAGSEIEGESEEVLPILEGSQIIGSYWRRG